MGAIGGSIDTHQLADLAKTLVAHAVYQQQMFRTPKRAVSLPIFDNVGRKLFADMWNALQPGSVGGIDIDRVRVDLDRSRPDG